MKVPFKAGGFYYITTTQRWIENRGRAGEVDYSVDEAIIKIQSLDEQHIHAPDYAELRVYADTNRSIVYIQGIVFPHYYLGARYHVSKNSLYYLLTWAEEISEDDATGRIALMSL